MILIHHSLGRGPKAKDYFVNQGRPIDWQLYPDLVRYEAKYLLVLAGHDAQFDMEDLSRNGLMAVFAGYPTRIRKADNGSVPLPGGSQPYMGHLNQQECFRWTASASGISWFSGTPLRWVCSAPSSSHSPRRPPRRAWRTTGSRRSRIRPLQQEPSVASGLARVEASDAAAKSFDAKVRAVSDAAAEAKRTGKAASVEVSFTEQELTNKAAEAVRSVGAGGDGLVAADPQIHLQGGNVVATSTVTIQGFQLKVGVVATPIVEDGKTKMVIQEIQTGALPIPDAIKQQLNSRIGATLDPAALGLPIEVSKLTIVDGKLVVAGTAR